MSLPLAVVGTWYVHVCSGRGSQKSSAVGSIVNGDVWVRRKYVIASGALKKCAGVDQII